MTKSQKTIKSGTKSQKTVESGTKSRKTVESGTKSQKTMKCVRMFITVVLNGDLVSYFFAKEISNNFDSLVLYFFHFCIIFCNHISNVSKVTAIWSTKHQIAGKLFF